MHGNYRPRRVSGIATTEIIRESVIMPPNPPKEKVFDNGVRRNMILARRGCPIARETLCVQLRDWSLSKEESDRRVLATI